MHVLKNLRINLLSAVKFIYNNFEVVFNKNVITMIDEDESTKLAAKRIRHLHYDSRLSELAACICKASYWMPDGWMLNHVKHHRNFKIEVERLASMPWHIDTKNLYLRLFDTTSCMKLIWTNAKSNWNATLVGKHDKNWGREIGNSLRFAFMRFYENSI